LRERLRPFVVQHRPEALSRYVARSGAVEIIADFLVISGNGLSHRAGSPSHEEPTRDFLSGTDFGERTEGGCIKIQGERFVVSVKFSVEGIGSLQSGELLRGTKVRDELAKLGASTILPEILFLISKDGKDSTTVLPSCTLIEPCSFWARLKVIGLQRDPERA